jgi:hypothetical protein
MQIPILSGIWTDARADFRSEYPRNLIPIVAATGINTSYLRPADGIVAQGTGPGVSRGGIEWDGVLYRVLGQKLCRIDAAGAVTVLGDIPGSDRVTMTYSFDYLAIAANGGLYLYDGSTLAQNADPDLGTVLDVIWVDGYFLTTDGEFLVITELNNPFAVDPFKYGSSEVDPDPVKAIVKLRNEVYALNRHTVEVFQNTGQTGFPFERVPGAQLQRGAIGTHCVTVFLEQIAFLGSGQNEAPGVWLGGNGNTAKISTREVDLILAEYTEAELATAFFETRVDRNYQHLLMHLPRKTLVYDGAASQVLSEPVWFCLSTSLDGSTPWRSQSLVWAYNRWNTADTTSAALGYLTDTVSTQWGQTVGWQFQTAIIYNDSRGAIVHTLELVALPGRVALGEDPRISTQYSLDGVTWSQPKWIAAGKIGDRAKRLQWLQQGAFRNWRVQRFAGTSDAYLSVARLEAQLEGLAW